jgi:hypothetical protein
MTSPNPVQRNVLFPRVSKTLARFDYIADQQSTMFSGGKDLQGSGKRPTMSAIRDKADPLITPANVCDRPPMRTWSIVHFSKTGADRISRKRTAEDIV